MFETEIYDLESIKAHKFDTRIVGPSVTFFGAVHGNEPCGPEAIHRLIQEFRANKIILTRGSVTLVPIANPAAFQKGTREFDRNLNRVFGVQNPVVYEEKLATPLKQFLDCDFFVDLHSYQVGGTPFIFVKPEDPATVTMASKLFNFDASLRHQLDEQNIEQGFSVSNFGGAIAASTNKPADASSIGTVEFARRNNRRSGLGAVVVTVECGQHKASFAPEVAYQVMRNAMGHAGITAPLTSAKDQPHIQPHIRLDTAVFRTAEQGDFAKPWKNFEFIKAGTLIAQQGGKEERAANDCHIVLPRRDAQAHAEWYYLGRAQPLMS